MRKLLILTIIILTLTACGGVNGDFSKDTQSMLVTLDNNVKNEEMSDTTISEMKFYLGKWKDTKNTKEKEVLIHMQRLLASSTLVVTDGAAKDKHREDYLAEMNTVSQIIK